jgi:hypothetical protein
MNSTEKLKNIIIDIGETLSNGNITDDILEQSIINLSDIRRE